jgi:glycosyltransferase involved in cell wall biosynthesis
MTLVFLNPSGQLGGAERSLLDVMASIRSAEPGWTLRLVATAEGSFVSGARALGVEATVLPLPPALAALGDGGAPGGGGRSRLALVRSLLAAGPATLGYLRRLRRVLRAMAPDVLHSNGFKMHVLGAWSRPPRTPLVWHVHDFVGRRPVMSVLLRRHAGRCAAVVANSRSVAEDVRSVCGGRVPVHPVYNAVDLEAFSPAGPRLDLDALAGLPAAPDGTIRVGLVATLGWWKGHETFLEAVARLPAELPVRAYVVGGALYETSGSQHSLDDCRRIAERLGLGGRVGFTGFVADAASAMRALDVVVHASTEPEPFGLVIVEAMGCGRPVIASRAGGAAELFVDGETALGHRPGDAADLARRIETLCRDPDLRLRLGRAGRAAAEARFDRARLADDLLPIYRQAEASR